jgi:hypothetical protein
VPLWIIGIAAAFIVTLILVFALLVGGLAGIRRLLGPRWPSEAP